MDLFASFRALHIPGDPLILVNVWDAGSARAVAAAGAPAIATGSWSVAAAHGADDAEALSLDLALANAARIAAAVPLPVSIDFEGAYAEAPDAVAANIARLAATGAIGCNFEDRRMGAEGLHPPEAQSARIAAARAVAGAAFFINARTDLFLQAQSHEHAGQLDPAIDRAHAYAEAGASGFFAPGLKDPDLIGRLASAQLLPLNIMAFPGVPDAATLASLGVARISHGPGPYRQAMAALTAAAAPYYRR